jgi:hypothetical protein
MIIPAFLYEVLVNRADHLSRSYIEYHIARSSTDRFTRRTAYTGTRTQTILASLAS